MEYIFFRTFAPIFSINNKTMKKLFLSFALLAAAVVAKANDGVYCGSGNQLVPVEECDIDVTKEILTIDICDDGYASVDVYYELTNHGQAKTVTMGFEADLPYMMGDEFNPKGIHPYIEDFTATMNGQSLSCSNAVVIASEEHATNFKPLDLSKYHLSKEAKETWDEGNTVLTDNKGNEVKVAYAYYFKANFNKGKNTVHHTYRYLMSNGVGRVFEVPYRLTPCARWANHQIDDFTLRIRAINTAKHFYLYDEVFNGATFKLASGTGKLRNGSIDNSGHYTEVSLRNGMVELHKVNFCPKNEMCISSADGLQLMKGDNWDITSFYDRAGSGLVQTKSVSFYDFYGRKAKNKKEEDELYKRICRNLPYANRGYVFKDKDLKKLFNKVWWYMPDPSWQMSADDFQKGDWFYINELGKNGSGL